MGLQFVTTPKPLDNKSLEQSLKKFLRSIRLRYYFDERPNDINEFDPKFHIPSTDSSFDPKGSNEVELYARKTTALFHSSLFKFMSRTYTKYSNLSKTSRMFLKELSRNKCIVIKPADKNLGLTLLDKQWYDNEILQQLADTSTYTVVDKSTVDTVIFELSEWIRSLTDSRRSSNAQYLSKQVKKYFTAKTDINNIRIPQIYILPKVHKPRLAGRPIVPSHSWITTPISIWLDHEIQPLLKQVPTVLKDSKELVLILETLNIQDSECWIITADVNSLYTEIPTNDGITLFSQFVHNNIADSNKCSFYIRLLEIILKNNYLQYNDKYYHQTNGTAMGTPAAVVYANIFMFMIENRVIEQFSSTIILYKRYLDDIFLILSGSADPNLITTTLNNMHPKIKLNFQISKTENEFLDLHIFKGERFNKENKLDIEVHQKSMNMYLYIPFTSFHTRKTKEGLVITELQRYIRNTSSFERYMTVKRKFYLRLRARGYPPKFLKPLFNSVSYTKRSVLLQGKSSTETNSTPFIFLTQYNPVTKIFPIRKIIMENWHILQKDKAIRSNLFSHRPIIGYSRSTNIQGLLGK